MIKHSVTKGIPYKKVFKIIKKELKSKSKDFRPLAAFLTFVIWIKNDKKNTVEECVKKLNTCGFYEKLFLLTSSEEWKITMSKWLNEEMQLDQIEIRVAKFMDIRDCECNIVSNKYLSLTAMFYFQCEQSLMKKIKSKESYEVGVKHTQKYLRLHQELFIETKKDFAMSINEIMVFLNLSSGTFNE